MRSNAKRLGAGIGLACLVSSLYAATERPWDTGPVVCYDVQAMSSFKRLPDALSPDAKRSDQLRLVAAQGEYEPASFVVAPRSDVSKFEVIPSALTNGENVIPVANVDIKVVKVWYQAGTAWYSYFGDSRRRELTPELLLKDETLIKVDTEKQENYLRVNDKYEWVSYPSGNAKEAFNYLTTPVADSKTLQPVQLNKGRNKQFWITVLVPESARAGIYRGKIQLLADGKNVGAMNLAVKVLPYKLPMPKTYYNLENPFLVTIYGSGIYDMCDRLDIPLETANVLQMKIYKNLLAHNVFNCRSDVNLAHKKDRAKQIAALENELRQMTQAGFMMKPLLSTGWSYPAGENSPDDPNYRKRIDDLAETLKKGVGHSDIYVTSWDEAGADRIRIMKEYSQYTLSKGLKLWVTVSRKHFDMASDIVGYANHGGWPDKSQADLWHSVGAKVASYAGPHTGPENPDVFRRWEGMARYKEHYDGSFNYKLYSALHSSLWQKHKANVWNDFMGGAFRGFNMAYPTTEGLIDTLAWEGFREGIDDIRYATKLKQAAAKAEDGTNQNAREAARNALTWLEALDAKRADLNAVRMEMIERIEKIAKAMGEPS
jgi:hypothetical protein